MTALDRAPKRNGDLPKGTYDATITNVATLARKDTDGHVLRLLVRTTNLGRDAVVWQGLADTGNDPLDLSVNGARNLHRFASKLGINVTDPEQILTALAQMVRDATVVKARVTMTPVGAQTSLYREPAVNGDVIAMPDPEATRHAWAAHQRVLNGLQTARHGLAHAAEGCYQLQETEGWQQLGFESLNEYLASPEVTLTRSEFYRLAAIWSAYVLDGGVEALALRAASPTKLEVPLPALGAGLVEAEQALADAESMTREDLRLHYSRLVDDDGDDGPEDRSSRRRDTFADWRSSDEVVSAVAAAREALGMAQRLPGARQAVRGALEGLVELVEEPKP